MSGLGEAAPPAQPLIVANSVPGPVLGPVTTRVTSTTSTLSSDPTLNDTTYQWIAKVFALALAFCTVAIVGVLCYRVAIDGNSALTQTITADLADNVRWLVLGLAAVILGKNAISAVIAKFTGAAGVGGGS